MLSTSCGKTNKQVPLASPPLRHLSSWRRGVREAWWETDAPSLTSSPAAATARPNFAQAVRMEVANLASISSRWVQAPTGCCCADFLLCLEQIFFSLLQPFNFSLAVEHNRDSSGSPPEPRLMKKSPTSVAL